MGASLPLTSHPTLLAHHLALPLVAPPARAQTNDARIEAEKRFAEGKRLFDERTFQEARNRFLEACAVLDTAACPKNLGVVEGELGMLPESATHLRQYLEDKRSEGDPVRVEIAKELSDLRKKLAELDIVAPAGAKVRLDDQVDVGKGPLTHTTFVRPGRHQVSAIWTGGGKTADVVADAGKLTKVDVTDPSAPSGDGTPVPPPPAKTEAQRVAFPPPTGAIVLGGVGLVGLGLGIGLGVASASAASDFNAGASTAGGVCSTSPADPVCTRANDQRNTANATGAAAAVAYVVGGAALVAGLVWWAVAPRRRQVTAVTPYFDAAGGGLALHGAF